MANKSIIDIQVNDETFKRFQQAFQDYSKDLEDQPETWKKLNKAVTEMTRSFSRNSQKALHDFSAANGVAAAVSDELKGATKAQHTFATATHKSYRSMHALSGAVSRVSKGLASVAKFGLTLGGITGGLGIGAALFGLPMLAESAMRTGIKSRQLGLSSGQLNAFNVHMANLFTSPQSYLQSIMQAQHNPTGATGLSLLTGVPFAQIGQMNTAKLGVLAAEKMHGFAGSHNNEFLQSWLQAYQLGGVFSLGEANLLAHTKGSLIKRYGRQALSPTEAKSLGFSQNAATAEAQFAIMLHRAGVHLESDLISKLAPLGPRLGQLSGVLSSDIASLVNNVLTPTNVKKMQAGIKSFADYLDSPAFHKKLQQFATAMVDVSDAVIWAAKKLHWAVHPTKNKQIMKALNINVGATNIRSQGQAWRFGEKKAAAGLHHIEGWWDTLESWRYATPTPERGWHPPLKFPTQENPVQKLLDEVSNIYGLLQRHANPPLKTQSNNFGSNYAQSMFTAHNSGKP